MYFHSLEDHQKWTTGAHTKPIGRIYYFTASLEMKKKKIVRRCETMEPKDYEAMEGIIVES